ncbi:MAG: DUF3768 domain-containing protein [Rhodospirillaceae bacterium]|nr:DUF3768 domain-containing protein [Rhodospirillaceae bacterium]
MAGDRIRVLNDTFRADPLRHGRLMVTAGVDAKGPAFVAAAVAAVAAFNTFTADNDPYGEHDFGAFDLEGERLYWKIDYYDRDLQFGSPDPANPAVTTRVLTIMLRDEY